VEDDGTPEAAEAAAEIRRFLTDYFLNGQLEIWGGSDDLLSRCDPFIPVHIDLDATLENLREAERKCRETAAKRLATDITQPRAAPDNPQTNSH